MTPATPNRSPSPRADSSCSARWQRAATTQGGGVIVRMLLTAQINFSTVEAAHIAVNDPMVDFIGDFTSTGGANGSMWFDQPNGQRKLRKAGAWIAL